MTTSTPKKFAVLLKPRPSQPALDRAAQYARMNPDFEIVAVRVINEYAETDDKDQIKVKEESEFERIRRSYSVDNISFKLIFNHDVAEGFIKECSSLTFLNEPRRICLSVISTVLLCARVKFLFLW